MPLLTNLQKNLAKVLTPLLETINSSHVTNSGYFINRPKYVNMDNKLVATVDTKSLNTNIYKYKIIHFSKDLHHNIKIKPLSSGQKI